MIGYIVINPIIAMPDKKISDLTSIAPVGSFTEFIPIEDTLSNANFKVAREQICPLIITSNSANSVATTSFMTSGSTNSLAIGDSATAGIKNSIVIGSDAAGNATTSPTGGDIAIGFLATAAAENAIVIGQNSQTDRIDSITIGSNTVNNYGHSVWIGHDISELGAPGTSINSVVIGDTARGNANSVAIGTEAKANFEDVSVGTLANADSGGTGGSIAVGHVAEAIGLNNIAIGRNAYSGAATNPSISIGAGAQNNADNTIVIGTNSIALNTNINTVAVGSEIAILGSDCVSIGFASAAQNDCVSIGIASNAQTDSVVVGSGASAQGIKGTVIGKGASATAAGAVAIGYEATTTEENAIVIGQNSNSNAPESIALGSNISNIGNNSVAVGFASKADNSSVAVGSGASSEAINTTAIGFGAATNATGAVAVGFSAQATATNAVQLGASYSNNNANTLQFLDKTIATLTGGIKINSGTTAPALSGAGFTGTPFFNGTSLQIFDGTTWQAIGGGSGTDSQTLSIVGQQLSISNGNTVTLPSGGSGTGTVGVITTVTSFPNDNNIWEPAALNTTQTLNGIAPGTNGQRFYLQNNATNYTSAIIIVNESTSEAMPVRRIVLNCSQEILCKGEVMQFVYSTALSRWVGTKLGPSTARFGLMASTNTSFWYQTASTNFTNTGSLTTGNSYYVPVVLDGATHIPALNFISNNAVSYDTLNVNIYKDATDGSNILLGEIVGRYSRSGPFTATSGGTLTSILSGYLPAGVYWIGFTFLGTATVSYSINAVQFKNYMPAAPGVFTLEPKMFTTTGTSLAVSGTLLTSVLTNYPICLLY